MTDRLKGFVVTLVQDLREDDAEATLTALRCIKGVQSVTPVKAGVQSDAITELRLRGALRDSLYDWIKDNL